MQSIDTLTAPQLEMASADLRNAGLVVRHAGRMTSVLVNRRDGKVCAVGAVELATYKRLSYLDGVREYITVPLSVAGWRDGGAYRCDNATLVLADCLPSGLCRLCDDYLINRHAADCKVCLPRTAYDKITHYNDHHCPSDELMVNLMGLGADKAMDLAADRRSLLAGRLSVGV